MFIYLELYFKCAFVRPTSFGLDYIFKLNFIKHKNYLYNCSQYFTKYSIILTLNISTSRSF